MQAVCYPDVSLLVPEVLYTFRILVLCLLREKCLFNPLMIFFL